MKRRTSILLLALFTVGSTAIAQEKQAQLPNGVKLEYVETGKADGTPVILLHGITDSWKSYRLVLPHLPKNLHAFAVSLRGHGNSDKPQGGYTPDDFAGDVASFMDVQKINRAYIIGHSMGATVAQRFLLNYPEKVMGVMLVGTFASFPGNTSAIELHNAIQNLKDPIDPDFANQFQVSTTAKPIPEAYLKTVVGESLKVPVFVWKAAMDGLMPVDYTAQLTTVDKPVTIFWGDRDSFCPRGDQQKLLHSIKGSSLVIYEGAGHALHWEEPKRFANDLAAFIENNSE